MNDYVAIARTEAQLAFERLVAHVAHMPGGILYTDTMRRLYRNIGVEPPHRIYKVEQIDKEYTLLILDELYRKVSKLGNVIPRTSTAKNRYNSMVRRIINYIELKLSFCFASQSHMRLAIQRFADLILV